MANQFDPRIADPRSARGVAGDVTFDAGLRSYMLSIYNYMASGVLLTGIIALFLANNDAMRSVFYAVNEAGRLSPTILGWVAMLSPLVMILVMNFGINRLSETGLKAMFFVFAGLMGVSLTTIFFRYTDASIAQTFFVTAASFAGLSLWGYTTKRDLSAMGKFLMMGLIGLLVAMIANIFIQSGPMQIVINMVGVLIFAGLTAYDTQRLKVMYDDIAGSDMVGKAAILGALTLYLNFINMFQFLLAMFGNRE